MYYELRQYLRQGSQHPIATFGGAFSNHILALATAARDLGIPCYGVIRGEQNDQSLSPTLSDAKSAGMELVFLSRENYRKRNDVVFRERLAREIIDSSSYSEVDSSNNVDSLHWVPEGGASYKGLLGVADAMRAFCKSDFLKDFNLQGSAGVTICHACGTGSTLAGMILGSDIGIVDRVLGFSVLKGEPGLHHEVEGWLSRSAKEQKTFTENASPYDSWSMNNDYHCGGYARVSAELKQFIVEFEQETGVALDPVYTAKMMFGVFDLIRQDYWSAGESVIVCHSGGLQGRRGYNF